MFQKIGYTLMPEGRYVPGCAERLVEALKTNLESELAECIKKLGSDRLPLRSLTLPDLLRMSSASITPNSPLYKDLVLLTTKVLYRAGFETPDIPYVAYNESPLLTAEDAVSAMLTENIPYITKAELGGDFATTNALKTFLPVVIRHIAEVRRLRPEYYARLRAKVADIGYKLFMKQPIDQTEKTMIINYGAVDSGSPGAALGSTTPGTKGVPITAQQNSNPLVTEAFELLRRSTLSGPGLQFYRLLSNRNIASLVYYLGPHVKSLPLTSGFVYARGPFLNLDLVVIEERVWHESDQLMGIRDRFTDFPVGIDQLVAGVTPGAESSVGSLMAHAHVWTLNAPIVVCGPKGTKCPVTMDLPEVMLELANESNVSKFSWQWWSNWRQQVRSSRTGATPDELFMDMALEKESEGQGLVDMLNIDSLKLVDMDASVTARKVSRANDRVYETIHFVRSGNTLETQEVDVTMLYSRGGTVMYKPAFSEYVQPPRYWYFAEDKIASEYICGQLGLTREQQLRNSMAITLSHNAACVSRLTSSAAPFNIKELIDLLLFTKGGAAAKEQIKK